METRTLDTVIYEKDGPVAWITLDYAEKANVQSSGLVFDVDQCLDDADRDYDIKVVVLKANGPGFSAGHVVTGQPRDRDARDRREHGQARAAPGRASGTSTGRRC